jgi:hypothetical protein
MAGKGDRPRPVNGERYRENYDSIFCRTRDRRGLICFICLDCAKDRVRAYLNPVWSPDFKTAQCDVCGQSKPGNPLGDYDYAVKSVLKQR